MNGEVGTLAGTSVSVAMFEASCAAEVLWIALPFCLSESCSHLTSAGRSAGCSHSKRGISWQCSKRVSCWGVKLQAVHLSLHSDGRSRVATLKLLAWQDLVQKPDDMLDLVKSAFP